MRWIAGLIVGAVLALAPAATGASPSTGRVVLVPLAGNTGTYQPVNSAWCVPASVATVLRAYGERHRVSEVAENMGQPKQDVGSTDPARAVAYLNYGQYEHVYSGRVWSTGPRFRQRVVRLVGKGVPVIAFTGVYYLPGHHTTENRDNYHAMTIVGYKRTDTGLRWQVWDPEVGFEWMRPPVLYNAMRHHYLGAYAIS